MDSISITDMSTDTWRAGVPRSPSHESVTTDLSLFSVSSAASDAKVLRLLACKAGQGPDPSTLRVASPNPDSKYFGKRAPYLLSSGDNCRGLLAGCACLCAALGVRRSFSCADLVLATPHCVVRNATSELALCAALQCLAATSRSASTRAAAAGSQSLSERALAPPSTSTAHNTKCELSQVRQNYIKKRLLSTYRALERMSQSQFNLDKLEAAAVSAVSSATGGLTLPVPQYRHTGYVHPEASFLALTAADLERERGRPLTKYERNMMIFNWLHSLDDAPQIC